MINYRLSLILEEHTILANQNYQPIDEQKEGQYYELIESILEKNGFYKYEVIRFLWAWIPFRSRGY